jgi:nitrogen fixation protein FixH
MEQSLPRDRWIPWYIVAFFIVFIAILGGFTWIAVHSYTGQVTEDAYKKGLAYNSIIAQADLQQALGWKSTLAVTPRGKTLDIAFTLKNASGQAISDAHVTASAIRPTQAGQDVHITLTPGGKGLYQGSVPLAWEGMWDLRISATKDGKNYQQSKTVIIQ